MPSSLGGYDLDRPWSEHSLLPVLKEAARSSAGVRYVVSGGDVDTPTLVRVSYAELYDGARRDANVLRHFFGNAPQQGRHRIVVLCFATHRDNVRWFWAVVAAGFIPCISPPFVTDSVQRSKNIAHLHQLLESPIFLTTQRLTSSFASNEDARVYDVESLPPSEGPEEFTEPFADRDIAALMLTSGSTGNSKAVCLSTVQMLSACAGKKEHGNKTSEDVFLNWIGLDHVANLVEMHLQATCLQAEQIHVQANDLLASPLLFLHLLSQQRVSVTFAPNFFLDLLCRGIVATDPDLRNSKRLNLSNLKSLYSGGEANVLTTAMHVTEVFQAYGARGEFLCPGYGLTESCAGITWAFNCPSYDAAFESEFTTCGYALSGARIRVVDSYEKEVQRGETGELQLSGSMVFSRYYNNTAATAEAFTQDGWFKTGDLARVDMLGQLYITGRIKDTININGVTYACAEIETAIEQARVPGLATSFTVAFPYRPKQARTEEYCIVYKPVEANPDGRARAEAFGAIGRLASAVTNLKPHRTIPLPDRYFDKASLGKLSRSKFKMWFEMGDFDKAASLNQSLVHAHQMMIRVPPSGKIEEEVLKTVCEMLDLDHREISVSSNIFSLGLSSLDSFTLIRRLRRRFSSSNTISLVDILREPTVRGMANVINDQRVSDEMYDPVVCLQPNGDKTPLWIVHPASGNVLAFVPLSRYLNDRPLYGLRASGVQPGERFFTSISQMAVTYFHAIKCTQPSGPYAIAGYSLGSTIAFEVSKLLIENGDEVRFTAALDSPPHIAPLVGNLTWSACLVMVSFFLDLIPERYSNEIIPRLWNEPGDAALDFILANADSDRLEALQLNRSALAQIADVADSFTHSVQGYEPSGSIPTLDVFVVDPLLSVVPQGGRKVWMDRHLRDWRHFVSSSDRNSDLKFHQCEGSHADMLNVDHVRSFQRILQRTLTARGV